MPLIQKIEPGDVIGRCRTIRELGRGGVGTVFLATHQTLQIEVALKVLSPALSMDQPALAQHSSKNRPASAARERSIDGNPRPAQKPATNCTAASPMIIDE